MHYYRICLALLHIGSALTYFPHLITHIVRIQFGGISIRVKIAYLIYWVSYSLLVLGVLVWCLIVVCRKTTIWQIIQISGHLLIAKLLYTIFDVTVRILLFYSNLVIAFDIIHIILLIPAILLTSLLVQHVQKGDSSGNKSQTLVLSEQQRLSCND